MALRGRIRVLSRTPCGRRPPPPRRDLPRAGCAVQECILGARRVSSGLFGNSWGFLWGAGDSPGGFWACSLVCKTRRQRFRLPREIQRWPKNQARNLKRAILCGGRGANFSALGAKLNRSWSDLGASWGAFGGVRGGVWGVLGRPLGGPGPSWALLGRS